MSSETRLEEKFENGVVLLAQGASLERAVASANGEAAELRPMLELVQVARTLPPRYQLDSQRRRTLAVALKNQLLAMPELLEPEARVETAQTAPSNPPQPLPRPRRNWFNWNIFIRMQQAIVVAVLVLAVGMVFGSGMLNRATNNSTPTVAPLPSATSIPATATPEPQPSVAPTLTQKVVQTAQPTNTPAPTATATPQPTATTTSAPTATATATIAPRVVATQPPASRSNPTTKPALPTATSAPQPTPTATPEPTTAAPATAPLSPTQAPPTQPPNTNTATPKPSTAAPAPSPTEDSHHGGDDHGGGSGGSGSSGSGDSGSGSSSGGSGDSGSGKK